MCLRGDAEVVPDPDDFVHARLIADMAPFHFQIEALTHHSVWGVEAVKTGVFAPPALIGAMPFAGHSSSTHVRLRACLTWVWCWRCSPPGMWPRRP